MNAEQLARTTAALEVGYMGDNPPPLQRVSVWIYRALAAGRTVTRASIAEAMGTTEAEIDCLLAHVPASAIDVTVEGEITGFVGLSIVSASHEFIVGSRTLYTWCAFDALFLPALIGQDAVLKTRCPETGERIEIELSPTLIGATKPAAPVMSLAETDTASCCDDLRAAFCSHVNMFADQGAFERWKGNRDGVVALHLDDAHQLARQRNAWRYPDLRENWA